MCHSVCLCCSLLQSILCDCVCPCCIVTRFLPSVTVYPACHCVCPCCSLSQSILCHCVHPCCSLSQSILCHCVCPIAVYPVSLHTSLRQSMLCHCVLPCCSLSCVIAYARAVVCHSVFCVITCCSLSQSILCHCIRPCCSLSCVTAYALAAVCRSLSYVIAYTPAVVYPVLLRMAMLQLMCIFAYAQSILCYCICPGGDYFVTRFLPSLNKAYIYIHTRAAVCRSLSCVIAYARAAVYAASLCTPMLQSILCHCVCPCCSLSGVMCIPVLWSVAVYAVSLCTPVL